ncbi:ABC transporter substrate-binding protein [Pandoraea thiooxydans]|uniref:ABC transporter substrate-binding protein n=1 Tax=Pandoraea thiooxydans TaxID=445709 RepID=A0A0G3EZZ4_9BURK|nr:winged helix DNA-binding protein [Pandoraea thiooxydans]AKJ70351.2 ABC transporter substrate-binding protein [Pandoraea thiooxydans]APR94600.1 ABC transporter substrate-binding protein [Pandoraea thiooxydans]
MPNTSAAKKTKSAAQAAPHHWHLATDAPSTALTDFEYALMRTQEAFVRWQSACLAAVAGIELNGQDNALLHVICMHGRPKMIKELMQVTNRQDLANVQYGLRKLMKAGLVSKSGAGRVGVYYAATEQGTEVCEAYAALRREVLQQEVGRLSRTQELLQQAAHHLQQLEKCYESAAREALTFYRRR